MEGAREQIAEKLSNIQLQASSAEASPRNPLQLKGALEQFKQFDVTPGIGREFQDVNLAEWLRAPNSDELIRDLAITSRFLETPISIYHADSDASFTAWCGLLPCSGRHNR